MTFKELRVNCGYKKQKEFAQAVGKKITTVCMWETGKHTPKTKDIIHIAKVLGVSEKEVLNCFNQIKEGKKEKP